MSTNKASGFTLLELMVTIAIIGILVSVALPSYFQYVQRSKVGVALEEMSAFKAAVNADLSSVGEVSFLPPIAKSQEFLYCISVDIRKRGRRGSCTTIHITAWPNESFDPSIRRGRTRMIQLRGELEDSGEVGWECGHFFRVRNSIDPALMPASCRAEVPRPRGRSCLTGEQRVMNRRCERGRG